MNKTTISEMTDEEVLDWCREKFKNKRVDKYGWTYRDYRVWYQKHKMDSIIEPKEFPLMKYDFVFQEIKALHPRYITDVTQIRYFINT